VSDLSAELRAEILHLLRERVDAAEIGRRTGATRARIGAINAHLTRGTYEKVQNVEMLDELEASTETTFGLERDLQNALRRNIARAADTAADWAIVEPQARLTRFHLWRAGQAGWIRPACSSRSKASHLRITLPTAVALSLQPRNAKAALRIPG
jgi:hypothetical protein